MDFQWIREDLEARLFRIRLVNGDGSQEKEKKENDRILNQRIVQHYRDKQKAFDMPSELQIIKLAGIQ